MMLSRRGDWTLNTPAEMEVYLKKLASNTHSESNPKGIFNLGSAENKLCEEVWLKKLKDVTRTIWQPQSLYLYNMSGLKEFRQTMCDFLTDTLDIKKTLDPEKLIVCSGVKSGLNAVVCAIANEGDYFLCPTPTYGSLAMYFGCVAGAKLYQVPMFDNPFQGESAKLNVNKIIKYYNKALMEGCNVKGIVLVNPNNPTGQVYSKESVMELLHFCKSEKLHTLVDEVYAFANFTEKDEFKSLIAMDVPDPDRTHFFYGFSKDMTVAGFRVGFTYCHNPEILAYVKMAVYFSAVPAHTQQILNAIITDKEWVHNVLLKTHRTNLKENYLLARQKMDDLSIHVYPGTSGFFLWVNLSKYMTEETFEGEKELFQNIFNRGVYLAPGRAFLSPHPGWFRLVFTEYKQHLIDGLERLESILADIKIVRSSNESG